MTTILIAEDDLLARVGIASMLNDNEDHLVVVGEAASGEEALRLARQLRPDILLTDVMMPGLNGIELIRTAKAENLCSHYVILSSYNDFDYVREGMRLGADDYLLKLDLKKDVLVRRLVQIAGKPDLSHVEPEPEQELRRREYEKERCIFNLITATFQSTALLEDNLEKCGLSIPQKNLVCIIAQDGSSGKAEPLDPTAATRILKTLIELSGNYGMGYGCMMSPYLFCTVISLSDLTRFPNTFAVQEKIRSDLVEYAHNAMNLTMNVLVSEPLNCYGAVSDFFRRYCRYDSGMYHLIQETNACGESSWETREISDVEAALEEDNYEKIEGALAALVQSLKSNPLASPKSLHSVCYLLLYFMERYFHTHPKISVSWHRSESMLTLNQTCRSRADYLRFLEQTGDLLLTSIRQATSSHAAIRAAEQYIRQNYQRDLSLDTVAAEVGLTPSYFCRLFSQDTGVSFTSYVKDIRIEQAKELLLTTNEKIQNIGERVGYPNLHYFCRIFKKSTGMTPAQFRREEP